MLVKGATGIPPVLVLYSMFKFIALLMTFPLSAAIGRRQHDDVIELKNFPRYCHLCGKFTSHRAFPAQRPLTRNFDVFFDLGLNERLSKQSWCWWFETPSRPLWRHTNGNKPGYGGICHAFIEINSPKPQDSYNRAVSNLIILQPLYTQYCFHHSST